MLNTSQHTSGVTCRQFKFQELQKITNIFSEDRIIGRGAYGYVYKGVMDDGQEIAVKKLIDMPLDHDSEKKFHDECIILLMVRHRNIMRLVGYCDETHRHCLEHEGKLRFVDKNERALCFEYLHGGSLDKHVSNEPCTLDWVTCYKIIKGVCEGLNHLHNGYKDSIFHLDLKPANILLDNNMIPKIGDFGLSRLVSTTKTYTTTTPLGTRGYIPPEFINKQEISPKYDVFSLGVVIIHIMAGRKHYNDNANNPSKIKELVCESWTKRLHGMMRSHASQEVMTCIEIGLRCVDTDRQERPSISKIVQDLNAIDIAKLSLTYEGTNLLTRDALDYNANSFLMGFDDNDPRFDSMEGIDYITKVSHEARDNNNSMHDPKDLGDSIMRDSPSTSVSEPRDLTEKIDVNILDDHRRNTHLRKKSTLRKIKGRGRGTSPSAAASRRRRQLRGKLCANHLDYRNEPKIIVMSNKMHSRTLDTM